LLLSEKVDNTNALISEFGILTSSQGDTHIVMTLCTVFCEKICSITASRTAEMPRYKLVTSVLIVDVNYSLNLHVSTWNCSVRLSESF